MSLCRQAPAGLCVLIVVLATGCCGPLACGPMACGPVGHGVVGHGSLGHGGCASGCGECYIDPWINEPATCDPCDACGNYNGQSCGSCRPVIGLIPSLWGYRYDGGCCDGGGCGACDVGCDTHPGGDCGCGSHGGPVIHGGGHGGRIIHEGGYGGQVYETYPGGIVDGHPTPLEGTIVEDEVVDRSYSPQQSKPIFRKRGPVVSRPGNSRF
ncbi:hypothetical protein [Roseimaritima sediminicola]|uniref:hypothetical protein n=1 Tax=Roseimaritima sediminicola TaxID=2662066 RepID=UPI001F3A8BDF|nr:hypothetical protein [Roseimaritima sediminicola]